MTERVNWEKEWLEEQQKKAAEVFKDVDLKTETSSPTPTFTPEEIKTILMNENEGVFSTSGFGFFDACDWEPKDDDTAWIIRDLLPKGAFGFIAGPPKGNASPHGGKSVLNRKMALAILKKQALFGHEILESGRIMFVNLDEDQDKQVRLYYRMTRGEKIPGYLISKARSCRLPEQIKMLEDDIKSARPIMVVIDPLQRIMGGKKVKEQSDVGPIIDELKRISKEYSCTIALNHHSNKDKERDKESTASWLSGSNDLDASWDFCLCLEYEKDSDSMVLRNFQKEKAPSKIFYEAEIINTDEIVDLHQIMDELAESKQARQIYNMIKGDRTTPIPVMAKKIGISTSSLYYQINKFQCIKKLLESSSNPLPTNNLTSPVTSDILRGS